MRQYGKKDVMGPSAYAIKQVNEVSRWNHRVYDLNLLEYFASRGNSPVTDPIQHTVFVTPKFICEVEIQGSTTTSFVKETAQKIFDNLVFE